MNRESGSITFQISIVIVTFNNQSHIKQTLKSLADALDGYSSQLVLIDNKSQDDTVTEIHQILDTLSFTSLNFIPNQQNTGFTRGVNQGVKLCSGEYVLILNPDIVCRKDTFEILFEQMKKQKAGVIAPQLRYPWGEIQPSCRRFPRKMDVVSELLGLARIFPGSPQFNRWRMPDFDHNHSEFVEQPQGAFLLMNRDVLLKTSLLDERFPMFFSDVDWCRRVYENGERIYFSSDTFVYHLKGASIYQVRDAMIVSSHRSFAAYFRKYDKTFYNRMATCIIKFLLLIILIPRILPVYILKEKS